MVGRTNLEPAPPAGPPALLRLLDRLRVVAPRKHLLLLVVVVPVLAEVVHGPREAAKGREAGRAREEGALLLDRRLARAARLCARRLARELAALALLVGARRDVRVQVEEGLGERVLAVREGVDGRDLRGRARVGGGCGGGGGGSVGVEGRDVVGRGRGAGLGLASGRRGRGGVGERTGGLRGLALGRVGRGLARGGAQEADGADRGCAGPPGGEASCLAGDEHGRVGPRGTGERARWRRVGRVGRSARSSDVVLEGLCARARDPGSGASSFLESRRDEIALGGDWSSSLPPNPHYLHQDHVRLRRSLRGQQGAPPVPSRPRPVVVPRLVVPPADLPLASSRRSASPRPSRSQRCAHALSTRLASLSHSSDSPPGSRGSTCSPRCPPHRSQTVVHYGWIPTILVVAWRASNPRPPIMRCAPALPPSSSSSSRLTSSLPLAHRLISPLA